MKDEGTPTATPDATQDDIRRGFVWLGTASVVARVLDAASVLVVMWFVSREQVGLATLAWSVAVLLEGMNGMGMATALLQTREVTAEKLTSAFWYTMSIATVLVLLVSALCQPLADWFGHAELAPMLIVSTTKLWFVGGALIPLNQLNRATRFERIAAVSTVATLCSGILTCVLAMLDFQAWALVIGQTSHGFFTLVGANLAHSFRPRGKPRLASIREDIAYGAKAVSASLLYQFYRNADYYLIARVLGVSALGLYRVAFDLAMTPTQAVSTVVNRSALPVYARMSERPRELIDAFLWTLRSLCVLLAPVTAVLLFMPRDLLAWVDQGKWVDAAPIVQWLALAALLRCIAQIFPQLFHALRRPALAVYESLLTMVLLFAFLALGLYGWGEELGPVVAAWAWLALYPIMLLALMWMTRKLLPLQFSELARSLSHGFFAMLAMSAMHGLCAWVVRPALPEGILAFAVELALLLGTFGLYVRHVMGVRLSNLSGKSRAAAIPQT